MGIFSRARDIISANLNALLDHAEDPHKLVGMMVREMEDTLVELKASCAGAMATRRRVQRELDEMDIRALAWAEKARRAVERGRDGLAREALLEKRRYEDRVRGLQDELAQCDGVVGQYQADMTQLEDKLKSVREKQRVLAERHVHALAKRRAEVNIRRVDTSEAMARLDCFQERIDQMEAEAGLVNFGRKPTLEQRFVALEDNDLDEELDRLKAEVAQHAEA
ncbi:MAG: phage shock protein A [bacterium]|nr:phage shock protein A [bacterium]